MPNQICANEAIWDKHGREEFVIVSAWVDISEETLCKLLINYD